MDRVELLPPCIYIGHMDIVVSLVQNGAASLASYLAAHVLLCLVPAC